MIVIILGAMASAGRWSVYFGGINPWKDVGDTRWATSRVRVCLHRSEVPAHKKTVSGVSRIARDVFGSHCALEQFKCFRCKRDVS